MVIDTSEKRRLRQADIEEQERQEQEEREKVRKNRNFVQFYRTNMPELRWLSETNGLAFSILLFVIEHMDNRNALACSYAILEDYFEKSRTTIYRAVKLLEDNGFVSILKMGNSNVYIVNSEVAWSSWGNQKEYCQFDGKILVSRKENKDYTYRSQFDKFKTLRQREGIK